LDQRGAPASARRHRRTPESPQTGEYQAPHPDTICRVLERLDAAEVDAAYARYRAAQLADLYDTNAAVGASELVAVSVDGKSQRGTGNDKSACVPSTG
jgi:hypothetical protein